MHLQGTVAATQGDAPFAIADHLDFLVTGCFDVQFNENVFVVANPRCFHLVEDFPHQLRRAICLANTENTLALAAAAADCLQAHAVLRVILGHPLHSLGERCTQFVDCVEVHTLLVGSRQHGIRLVFQGDIRVIQLLVINRKVIGGTQGFQCGNVRVLLEQGKRSAVVDTRSNRYTRLQRRTLGFVLEAGIVHRTRAGANKVKAGTLHSRHHGLVFRHEAIAGENGVVAVVVGNTDDLRNALVAFFLVRPGVVRHAVDTIRVCQRAQFRRLGVAVDNRVFLREQDTEMLDTHLGEDIHRLFANGAATDNQRPQARTIEATHPGGGMLRQAAVAVNQGIAQVKFIGHAVFPQSGDGRGRGQ